MAHARKKLPVHAGRGELRLRGERFPVDYEVSGEPGGLKLGPNRLRGSFTATPEIAEQAFRQGEAQLTLDDGSSFRVTLLGHSAGSDTAFFELRV